MIPIQIRKSDDGPGVTLEWSPTGDRPWLIHSFHVSLPKAKQQWYAIENSSAYDHDETHWRIVVWHGSAALHVKSLRRRS